MGTSDQRFISKDTVGKLCYEKINILVCSMVDDRICGVIFLNLIGVFNADFNDYKLQFTTTLESEKFVNDGKSKVLVFKVVNSTNKDWRQVEYSIVLRDGNSIIYPKHAIDLMWKVKAQSIADLKVEMPSFESDVEVILEVSNLRGSSIFR